MDLVIGGVAVAALVFGLVEMVKDFGADGNVVRILAVVFGFFLSGLALAVDGNLIPPEYAVWVELVVKALAGALAAGGYYSYLKRRAG